MPSYSDGPRTTLLGKLVILAFIGACGYGAYRIYLLRNGMQRPPATTRIAIACSPEKTEWLTSAAMEFTKRGGAVVELLPSQSEKVQVWAPARSVEKELAPPYIKVESIALTPMVFVVWSERMAAFQSKYGEPSFAAFARALAEPRGWEGGGHPEWGFFTFGIEDREAALALIAYEQQEKANGLTPHDALVVGTGPTLHDLARNASPDPPRDFASRGPSAYDAAFVYESSALAMLDAAQKRWGELRIVYPGRNLWNDNPYYILDVSWSTPEQRKAAQDFLSFLLSETGQQQAITHGFRPADPHVTANTAGSPFLTYQKNGVRENVGQVCVPPPAAVIDNLLAAWQRAR